jgi:hypothetical protein
MIFFIALGFILFHPDLSNYDKNFNHKSGSAHNHSLTASLSWLDNFYADQPGTEHKLFPSCQPTCIF